MTNEKKNIQNATSGTAIGLQSSIESRILNLRDKQVMLDRDLAKLYGVETRVLNQAVKRNINRFPEDFMFQLTREECLNIYALTESQNNMPSSRSQIVTMKTERGKNIKYLPYAFTEQGIAMLSGILRSDTAIEVNIRIMRELLNYPPPH